MSGNVDTRTEIIDATGIVKLANANFLFVVSATANVAFKLIRSGLAKGANQENYSGQLAGLQISRTQRWDFATVTGAPGVTITFMYGYADIREDVTLFNQQIAVISGVTAVAAQPASGITDAVPVNCVAGSQAALIAANLLRRRVTLTALSTNTQSVFIRKSAGANNLFELQPGTFAEFDNTSALDYNLAAGANQTVYVFEET